MDNQILDLTRICRTCLSSDAEMKLLFPVGAVESQELEEIRKMIADCTIYPVQDDSNFPDKICTKCIEKVKVAHQFKIQCEKSYEMLTSIIESYRKEPKSNLVIDSELVIVKEEKNGESDFETISLDAKTFEHRCQLCPKVFSQEVHLRKHLSTTHWNNETICILCSKSCGSASKLKKHILACHPLTAKEEQYVAVKCEECGEDFDTNEDLEQHSCCKVEDPFDTSNVQVMMEAKESDDDADDDRMADDIGVINDGSDNDTGGGGDGDNAGDNNDVVKDDGDDANSIKNSDDDKDEDYVPLAKLSVPKQPKKQGRKKSSGKKSKSSKSITVKKEKSSIDKDISPVKKENKCEVCGKIFTRATHLRRHALVHSGVKPYYCSQCQKSFTRLDHLNKHQLNHSEVKPHVCPVCERGFTRAEHLRRHMETRHGVKTTNPPNPKTEFCGECNRGFTTAKYLQIHMRSHEQRKFVCKFCTQEFRTKAELNEHSKMHAHERPFLCSECGLRFVRNDYLVIHMRRHKGEKPYKCKFCNKGFPRATDLNVHERYHTGEKTHLCTVCGKGFQRAYNLLVHTRVHTGERPYKCPHCDKSFAQGNDLKSHIRRHTGERFKCDVCDEGFIQGYHLTQHKRNVHGIDMQSHIRRVEKFVIPGRQKQQTGAIEQLPSSITGNDIEMIEPSVSHFRNPAEMMCIEGGTGNHLTNYIKMEAAPHQEGYQSRIGGGGESASEIEIVTEHERPDESDTMIIGDQLEMVLQMPCDEYVKCETRVE